LFDEIQPEEVNLQQLTSSRTDLGKFELSSLFRSTTRRPVLAITDHSKADSEKNLRVEALASEMEVLDLEDMHPSVQVTKLRIRYVAYHLASTFRELGSKRLDTYPLWKVYDSFESVEHNLTCKAPTNLETIAKIHRDVCFVMASVSFEKHVDYSRDVHRLWDQIWEVLCSILPFERHTEHFQHRPSIQLESALLLIGCLCRLAKTPLMQGKLSSSEANLTIVCRTLFTHLRDRPDISRALSRVPPFPIEHMQEDTSRLPQRVGPAPSGHIAIRFGDSVICECKVLVYCVSPSLSAPSPPILM
jgi:hypothetical protein